MKPVVKTGELISYKTIKRIFLWINWKAKLEKWWGEYHVIFENKTFIPLCRTMVCSLKKAVFTSSGYPFPAVGIRISTERPEAFYKSLLHLFRHWQTQFVSSSDYWGGDKWKRRLCDLRTKLCRGKLYLLRLWRLFNLILGLLIK